ncbi:hypothetical protein YPPY36_4501, partial [Yersinia pestis PY-36]
MSDDDFIYGRCRFIRRCWFRSIGRGCPRGRP